MLGFTAQALSSTIDINKEELSEADWYSPTEIKAAVAKEDLLTPRPDSIAGAILREWIENNS